MYLQFLFSSLLLVACSHLVFTVPVIVLYCIPHPLFIFHHCSCIICIHLFISVLSEKYLFSLVQSRLCVYLFIYYIRILYLSCIYLFYYLGVFWRHFIQYFHYFSMCLYVFYRQNVGKVYMKSRPHFAICDYVYIFS